jgi:hypothetical protein
LTNSDFGVSKRTERDEEIEFLLEAGEREKEESLEWEEWKKRRKARDRTEKGREKTGKITSGYIKMEISGYFWVRGEDDAQFLWKCWSCISHRKNIYIYKQVLLITEILPEVYRRIKFEDIFMCGGLCKLI